MANSVRVYPMYGFMGAPFPWGFGYSKGIDVLAGKLKTLGCTVLPTKGWTQWDQFILDVKSNSNAKIVILGHSMGANASTWLAQTVAPRTVDLLIAFDCEYKASPPTPLGANVKTAICFYGTNWLNPVGHGQLKAGSAFKGSLKNIPTNQVHQLIDDEEGSHSLVVNEVKKFFRKK